jgi:hypothetical protein
MAEVAAEQTGVELTPEMLAQDEELIRKLQELQRMTLGGDEETAIEETATEETVAEETPEGAGERS